MSGNNLSSAGLDPRRRRILFRAWRRGVREMDLVMGQFADANLPTLSEAELDEFERLLDATPAAFDTPLFARLRAAPAASLRNAETL